MINLFQALVAPIPVNPTVSLDLIQDLLKPVIVGLILALSFFVRSNFKDLKGQLEKLTKAAEAMPEKYVQISDCEKHVDGCLGMRKEQRMDCRKNIDALQEVTSNLVECVYRHLDCSARRRD